MRARTLPPHLRARLAAASPHSRAHAAARSLERHVNHLTRDVSRVVARLARASVAHEVDFWRAPPPLRAQSLDALCRRGDARGVHRGPADDAETNDDQAARVREARRGVVGGGLARGARGAGRDARRDVRYGVYFRVRERRKHGTRAKSVR